MGKHSRPTTEKLERLQRASALYLQGFSQAEIGREVGVSQQTISNYMAEVREMWKESALFDYNEMLGRELAKIDALEMEFWEAWRRSCGEKVRKRKHESRNAFGNTEKTELTQEAQEQVGDPRFLQGVLQCVDRRCKLLGLDAPERRELSGPDGSAVPLRITEFEIVSHLMPDDVRPPIPNDPTYVDLGGG